MEYAYPVDYSGHHRWGPVSGANGSASCDGRVPKELRGTDIIAQCGRHLRGQGAATAEHYW